MRLTVAQLRKIIKEEVTRVVEIADADRSDFSKEGMRNTPEDQLPRTLEDFKRDIGRLVGVKAKDFDFHNGEPLNLALKGNGFYSLKYVLKDLEELLPSDKADEVGQMISELKKLMREMKGQVSEFQDKKDAAGSFGKEGMRILQDELKLVSSLPERLETIFAPYV